MADHALSRQLIGANRDESSALALHEGSRVAVIGGGPAGSFFTYFLLDMAERIGLRIYVDIYEPRDFRVPGPAGCNMCGGVLYESLVQSLAIEGINLPTSVVQRGIECNKLHLDIGNVEIWTRRREKRIATTFRGSGPPGLMQFEGVGLDRYLMQTAMARGAQHIRSRVAKVGWLKDRSAAGPESRLVGITTQTGLSRAYELVAVACGVNTSILQQFQALDFGYRPPQTTKLSVREYRLGKEAVSKYVGSAFHAFLLDIPGLDYGAIIPKGDYVTICLLSSHEDLDTRMMEAFVNHPAVAQVLPLDLSSAPPACHCSPRINTKGSQQPFGERVVFIGDSGVSRLYKDGIGAAYRAAKIAASTAVFHGISSHDFERHYLPFCRRMEFDNQVGRLLFALVGLTQKTRLVRRAILRLVSREQDEETKAEHGMSGLIWDMLTGGAPFLDVLMRAAHPALCARLFWSMLVLLLSPGDEVRAGQHRGLPMSRLTLRSSDKEAAAMDMEALGRLYQDGETIVRQGELGDCMYVVQDGRVEVVAESENAQIQLNVLGKDEFFGEMAIFDHEIRSATVRALGPARILTVDHRNFLRRIHEDSSLAYRLMQVMSERVRKLSSEVAQLKQSPIPADSQSSD